MAHEMNEDRIGKWQCIFCGSRSKKIGELKSGKDTIGRSLICCNCGCVENFALNVTAIPIYIGGGQTKGITGIDIKCGIPSSSKLKCNIDICDIGIKTKCPLDDNAGSLCQSNINYSQKERVVSSESTPNISSTAQVNNDIIPAKQVHQSSELVPIKKVTVGRNKYN